MTRAFVLASFAWALGLAIAIVLGLLLAVFVPGPAAAVAGPLVLGLAMGIAQRQVLGSEAVTRAFVPLTAVGATLGWLLGCFVGWRLFVDGHEALAPWANGPVVGLVVGIAQSLALRGPEAHRWRWTIGSALAWTAAIAPWLIPGVSNGVRFAAFAAPGIHAALVSLLRHCPLGAGRVREAEPDADASGQFASDSE
jgi:hypothetical protein